MAQFFPTPAGTVEGAALSLGEIKQHLRITHELEDQDLEMRAAAAQANLRWHMGPIVKSDWTFPLDEFKSGYAILLPVFKSRVTAIRYQPAGGGAAVLVSADVYESDEYATPGRVVLAAGKSWPSVELVRLNGVLVDLEVGWEQTEIPADLKAALLLEVGHLYENRESVMTDTGVMPRELPRAVDTLIAPYRVRESGWIPEACL